MQILFLISIRYPRCMYAELHMSFYSCSSPRSVPALLPFTFILHSMRGPFWITLSPKVGTVLFMCSPERDYLVSDSLHFVLSSFCVFFSSMNMIARCRLKISYFDKLRTINWSKYCASWHMYFLHTLCTCTTWTDIYKCFSDFHAFLRD